MNELRLMVVLCALGLAACGAEPAEPASEETVSAEAETTETEAAEGEETEEGSEAQAADETQPGDVDEEEFPMAEDFAEEATAAITDDTLEQQLAALEAEIGED